MEKISIIIPTFNNIKGLNYLLNYFKDKPYRLIIIVDNNVKIKKLSDWRINQLKKIIYLPQNKNLGFAKAVNLGAKYVKSKWLAILNDDIEFEVKISKSKNYQNDFNLLIDFAEKNKLDAISPILINPDGEVENMGYKILPYGKIQLIKELTDLRVNELDGLTAACLLIKTDVFKNLGGFDESFFAYLEDVEFFIRFKKKGFKMGVAPIEVIHRHMTTSKTMGSFKAKQDLLNWWRLYFKHPEIFKFNLRFLIERLKNLKGFLKLKIYP